MKYKKGFNSFDIYCGEDDNGFTVRRKIFFFYSIPIWCKQYKIT
jgi:hypothetical protein